MNGFDFLIRARKFGMKLGLETMQRLSSAFGNPEKHLKFIHIAGTNGKGSTASLCSRVLLENNARVGLFTSPHLISITERIQINQTPLCEKELNRLLDLIAEETRSWDTPPTFFEILTLVALLYFQENEVDWVVWETGMGGRLDSTNIVTPEVSIITSISLDHQEFLGNDLTTIAREKAGIIKPNIPVVCAPQVPEVYEVIRNRAFELNSPFFSTQQSDLHLLEIKDFKQSIQIQSQTESFIYSLSLLGKHQTENAHTAYIALSSVLKIPHSIIQQGFSNTIWNGRFQILRTSPPLVIDGAHNPASMASLVETWKSVFPEIQPHLIFGVMGDKEISPMIKSLLPFISQVTLVSISNPRCASPESLQPLFSPLSTHLAPSISSIWDSLLQSKEPILITGSLFLVGEALSQHLKMTHSHFPNELLR